MKRIFVNGIGAISAAGNNVAGIVSALSEGKSFIAPVTRFETAIQSPAGEVQVSDKELKRFLEINENEIISRTALLALTAIDEAVNDYLQRSGLESADAFGNGCRVAFISGTSVGGMDLSEVFWAGRVAGMTDGNVEMLKMHDPGAVTSAIASKLGGRGICPDMISTISTACSAAGNAIMLGARMIQAGQCDVAIVGGTDALCKFTMNGFNSLRILDPQVCRPFDESRVGLNLGEGAGYLILTSEDTAAYCSVSGWGNANEAYHQTASTPEGIGPGMSMTKALECSGLKPSDIDFVNTHGTGTQVNDQAESNAMLRIFEGNVPPFSSLKGYFGHTLGASEGIEAALVCKAIDSQDVSFMHSCGFSTPISETGLVPYDGSVKVAPRNIMSSAFGFSGNCVSLIFSK